MSKQTGVIRKIRHINFKERMIRGLGGYTKESVEHLLDANRPGVEHERVKVAPQRDQEKLIAIMPDVRRLRTRITATDDLMPILREKGAARMMMGKWLADEIADKGIYDVKEIPGGEKGARVYEMTVYILNAKK